MHRFIPLGDSHVNDVVCRIERPVNTCRLQSAYVNKSVYAAIILEANIEVLFRIDPAYDVFLRNSNRRHGIVLSYEKELEEIDYLSTRVVAIQVSHNPVVYVPCLPIDTP